jgi:hypothetical protein
MQSCILVKAMLALHRAWNFEAAAQLLYINLSTMRRRIQALDRGGIRSVSATIRASG